MKIYMIVSLLTLVGQPGIASEKSWIEDKCKLAIAIGPKPNVCTREPILCVVYGVNVLGTSGEQRGCLATSLLWGNSEYKPPVPLDYLNSPNEVMTDGACNGKNILTLLFGKRVALLGNLPLLIANRNTSDTPLEWQMHIIHDETESNAAIKRFGAMFGISVSM